MQIVWKRIGCALVLVAALAGLAGCGSHTPPAPTGDTLRQALAGKTWTLIRVVNRDMETDPPMTLKFNADGTVEGFGGCNTFKGTYTLAGDSLTFGPLTSTHTSCGPAADEQEYTFKTFLAKIVKASLDENELSLLTDNQTCVLLTSGSSGFF